MPDFQINAKGTGAPGVGNYSLYAAVEDFEADGIKTPPAAPATQAEKVTIADTHTFQTGLGFRKMYVDQPQSAVMASGFGGNHNGGAKVELEAFFPGSKAEFDAFLKDDPDMIVLVPGLDCDNPVYEQVGTKCSPARIDREWTYSSGKAGESDPRGYAFKIYANQSSRLHYTGTATMAT